METIDFQLIWQKLTSIQQQQEGLDELSDILASYYSKDWSKEQLVKVINQLITTCLQTNDNNVLEQCLALINDAQIKAGFLDFNIENEISFQPIANLIKTIEEPLIEYISSILAFSHQIQYEKVLQEVLQTRGNEMTDLTKKALKSDLIEIKGIIK